MISKIKNPDRITSAEIVVGIPSYNEADSIAVPVKVASEGLLKHFADYSSAIVNVDNHSPDGTDKAFLKAPGKVPKIYVSTPEEVKGKGYNLRNLFEVAAELKAKAIVTVDADLQSITPSWIQHLAEPLFDGHDYVVPIYTRHKYDGTITKNIAYPLVRTLYGLRVRQPIGGDFGVSGKLARCYLVEKTWSNEVANFGIDIWMTTIAIGRHFKVCQTFMGSPKIHRTKDPASHLGPMFCQVVGAIFQLMMDFEFLWKDTFESRPSTIYGFGLGDRHDPPEVKVSRDRLHASFSSGSEDYRDLWKQVLSEENWKEVQKLKRRKRDKFQFPNDLWAHVLFDFAAAYKSADVDRAELLTALIPFYFARVLSFVNKTRDNAAEEYMEEISRIFEQEKYYLVQRWNQSLREHGVAKVADLLVSSD